MSAASQSPPGHLSVAELLRRGPDGTWPAVAEQIGQGSALRLDSVGLALPLADVYRTTSLV